MFFLWGYVAKWFALTFYTQTDWQTFNVIVSEHCSQCVIQSNRIQNERRKILCDKKFIRNSPATQKTHKFRVVKSVQIYVLNFWIKKMYSLQLKKVITVLLWFITPTMSAQMKKMKREKSLTIFTMHSAYSILFDSTKKVMYDNGSSVLFTKATIAAQWENFFKRNRFGSHLQYSQKISRLCCGRKWFDTLLGKEAWHT